ncbi:MAG: CoA pyrophosphatase [Pseudomonadota bacterium]
MFTCDSALREKLTQHLSQFEVRQQPDPERKHAAVAITVIDNGEGQAAFILTRRAARLRSHGGQWALPGGRLDEGETPTDAALRELEEEVGLTLGHDDILGTLDDYTTRSGYIMTPVIAWSGEHPELTPNPGEVAAVFRIPFTELMREDAPQIESIPESDRPVIRMPIDDGFVNAPTAALLYQFREVAIQGKETRVAHYEQPVFAWK